MSKFLKVMMVFLLSSAVVLQAQELQEEKDSITWSLDVEDVVVTASYAPTDTRSAIHLVRVLGQEDIQRLQARNLQQLLVTDVNIRMQQDPALGSRANLAGMDGQNIKIMVDGVPVVGRLDGNIDLSQIQLYDVERVEIVEGPLAVNYGTDALAGVINIITKKSQLNRYNVQLDASYEDRGERTTALGIGMRVTDDLLLRAQVGLDEFAGFDPDSTRSTNWNPKVQEFANATARYNFSDHHHIRYTFKWLNEEVTNLGDVLRPQFRPYSFDERYITKRNDHALHYEGSVQDKWYISSFVAHNSFDRQVDHWRKDFESGENMAVPKNQDTSQVRSWHSRTTLAMQNPDSWVDFMVGMDHRYEDFRGRRVTNPDNENDNFAYILDNAIFGSAKFKLFEDKLLLESGVRYAINNRFTAPVLPSINAKFQLNENWTFRGSYGKGFRAPDIKELFFSFIDINHFILGNPELRPETSDNYQAGFTYYRYHKDQEFTMGFHGFYNHVRDRIELYEYVETPNGKAPAVDTLTNDYTYFNIDEFRSTGLNVRMGYERSNWRIKAAYGLIGLYNEGYDDFDEFGRYTFTHEVSIDGRYTIPWINTDLQLVYRFHDNRVNFYPDVDDEGNAVVGRRFIEGFTNLDASLGKSFLNDRLRLTAGVRNLLAVTDVQVNGDNSVLGIHSTGQSRQLISTGRRWFVGMTYNLAW